MCQLEDVEFGDGCVLWELPVAVRVFVGGSTGGEGGGEVVSSHQGRLGQHEAIARDTRDCLGTVYWVVGYSPVHVEAGVC